MTKITTDFVDGETAEVTKQRFTDILEYWGYDPEEYQTFAEARRDFNELLAGTALGGILGSELASSFKAKINLTNDPAGLLSARLFDDGSAGIFLDASDITTLFQDTAGTTPVTAPGQTVARINDKSGNGFNATQATAGSRPTYQVDADGNGYLSFDGVDDFLVTPTITPNTDKVQVFAGVRRNTEGSTQAQVLESSTNIGANNGTFGFAWPFNSANQIRFQSKGTVFSGVNDNTSPALTSAAITLLGDISSASVIGRKDGIQVAQSSADQGTGNYLAYPLYICSRAGSSFFFNGHIHQLIVRFGSNLPLSEIQRVEQYVASKTAGVTIP